MNIYLLSKSEDDYDDYQETVLRAYHSEHEANVAKEELEATKKSVSDAWEAAYEPYRQWIAINPRPAWNGTGDDAFRAWAYERMNVERQWRPTFTKIDEDYFVTPVELI